MALAAVVVEVISPGCELRLIVDDDKHARAGSSSCSSDRTSRSDEMTWRFMDEVHAFSNIFNLF